jgi:hypothetical protein
MMFQNFREPQLSTIAVKYLLERKQVPRASRYNTGGSIFA